MRTRLWLVVVLGSLIAAGALVGAVLATDRSGESRLARPPEGPYRGSEPPPDIRIPNVTLPSYRGGRVSLRAQTGKVVVLTFLDSRCEDTCPIVASLIGRTWPSLSPGERSQVRIYSISVNPHADTAPHIRRFLAARRALTALDWLVAPVREMRSVWRAFGVLPAVDTGDDDIHSVDVRVFDRAGRWVSTLHSGVDLTRANLAHDIRRALRPSN